MKSDIPLISILMTSYNREEYIGEAIESVLTYSNNNFELILVDDCSTDKTFEIIKQYASKDQRIRYYQNEINLGDYPNRNKAASYAKAAYITYVDSDDKMLPDSLAEYYKTMLQFEDAGIGMYMYNNTKSSFCMSSKDAIHYHFFRNQLLVMGPGGTIIKRSFFEEIKGYPEKYGPANDMYFNLKAASHSDIVFFPFAPIFYRVHEAQESNNYYSYLYNNYLYLRDALVELHLPLTQDEKKWIANKNKRRFLINTIKYFFKTKNLMLTKKILQKAGFGFKDAFEGIFHLN